MVAAKRIYAAAEAEEHVAPDILFVNYHLVLAQWFALSVPSYFVFRLPNNLVFSDDAGNDITH